LGLAYLLHANGFMRESGRFMTLEDKSLRPMVTDRFWP